MKVLALEQERHDVQPTDFLPHLNDEAAAVWRLQQRGVIRELYFRSDRREAVLILECKDTDEARHLLGALPLVQVGVITFEIIGLQPYDGFARLFAEEQEGVASAVDRRESS